MQIGSLFIGTAADGNVIEHPSFESGSSEKFMQTETYMVSDVEQLSYDKECTHVYVHSIRRTDNISLSFDNKITYIMRFCTFKAKVAEPKTPTYSTIIQIDDSVYEEFSKIANKMAIDKSKFIENYLKDFIQKYK